MNRPNLDTKRQLLADLLIGYVDGLRAYKAAQQRAASPYRWVIHDEVNGKLYGVGQDGQRHLLTADILTQVEPAKVWRVVDYTGGRPIPEPDEDYRK